MPVAIVTGACSGIGLALTRHLHRRGWKVFMADTSGSGTSLAASFAASPVTEPPTFVQTDVADYAAQAALFAAAFAHAGDIALFAANAGVDDGEDLLAPSAAVPPEPARRTLDVDLHAVLGGLRLFAHYARRVPAAAHHMVITASMAGQYPFPSNPVYAAAKHALVGLARSAGARLQGERIYVGAVMPAFVETALAPPGLADKVRERGHVTPMETVLKGFDELLAWDGGGGTVECTLDKVYWRKHPEFANESQRFLIEDPEGWWSSAYDKVRQDQGT